MESSGKKISFAPGTTEKYPEAEIRRRLEQMGKCFHNMNLGGIWTAPDHFLGNYPAIKWQTFSHLIPDDLSGKTPAEGDVSTEGTDILGIGRVSQMILRV